MSQFTPINGAKVSSNWAQSNTHITDHYKKRKLEQMAGGSLGLETAVAK